MDDTTKSKVKEDLVGTGIFLESDTYNLFSTWKHERVFRVHREYPYGFQLHGVTLNGTSDIVATCGVGASNPFFLVFVIECKKANPELKHWVFEKNPPKKDKERLFYPIVKKGSREYTQDYWFRSLGYDQASDLENTVNVFEFNKVSGKIKNQAQKELRAYYAIKQANEAATGMSYKFNSASTYAEQKELPHIIVPIVVTTANLWVANYNVTDINKEEGSIDAEKIELQEKNWVLHAYPLEYTDLYGGQTDDNLSVEPDKRPTFIVKASHLEEFVQWMIADWKEKYDW